MSRAYKNSLLFAAETIARKPAWLRRQLGFLEAPVASPATLPLAEPPKPSMGIGMAKAGTRKRVPRTHNNGTMTEAQFWGAVRSGLRRAFRFWKPALAALQAARVQARGPHGRKWLYLCAGCGKLFPRKQVQMDHVTPCGSLRSFEEVGPFLQRLCAPSPQDYQILCNACHDAKTARERDAS